MSDSSTTTSAQLTHWLRAAGETTRLRLLALCAERDLSVSDLAVAVGQSEPRVSRASQDPLRGRAAGALAPGPVGPLPADAERAGRRFRPGSAGSAHSRRPGAVARPRPIDGRQHARQRRHAVCASESRLGRALRAFVEGTVTSTTLRSSSSSASIIWSCSRPRPACRASCTAIAHSRRAAQAARSFARARRVRLPRAARAGRRVAHRAGHGARRRSLSMLWCWIVFAPRAVCSRTLLHTPRARSPQAESCGCSSATNLSRRRANASSSIRSRACAACSRTRDSPASA